MQSLEMNIVKREPECWQAMPIKTDDAAQDAPEASTSRLEPPIRTHSNKTWVTSQISNPLYKQEDAQQVGAGHGFVDNMLLPRCHFRPLLPLSALRSPAQAAALSGRKEKRLKMEPPSPDKGKEVAAEWFTKPEPDSTESQDTSAFAQRLEGQSISKAGITRDAKEISLITYEAGRGSKFFDREREKDVVLSETISIVLNDLEAKMAKKRGNLNQEEADVEHLAKVLEKERDLSQCIACIDADAFYASVETFYNPSLKGQAFVVGEGIILTASYEARAYGCRSAMGGHVAKKLLPDVIFVKPSFDKYMLKSKGIMAALGRFGKVAQCSIDEAYLNLTDLITSSGKTSLEIVQEIRKAVKAETGLSVSCGVGSNKMLAKIAADINKPDNQYIVEPTKEAAMAFMAALPVRKIPGIGKTSEAWLKALSIHTCADVWKERGRLGLLRCDLTDIIKAYLGIGDTNASNGSKEDRGSCGRGWTFAPTSEYEQWIVELQAMAQQVSEDLATAQLSGRTIGLEMKYDTFEVEHRSHTSTTQYYKTAEEIYEVGKKLLDKELEIRQRKLKQKQPVKGSYGAAQPILRRMSLRLSHLRDDSKEAASLRGENGQELFKWMSADFKPVIDLTQEEDVIPSATCPICSRKWTNVLEEKLHNHIDRCLEKPCKGGRLAGRKRKHPDAFSHLMSRRTKT